MADEDDRIWRLTPISRSLVDFDAMVENPPHAGFFRDKETIKAMHEEQKRLSKMLSVAYLITAALAFFMLFATPKTSAKMSFFGIEASLNSLSQQVLAVFLSGVFGYYTTLFLSFIVLTQMIGRILALENKESWVFLGAPFDATGLWGALLVPKRIGYSSPKRLLLSAGLVVMVPILTVMAHALVVGSALAFALVSAWRSPGWLGTACAIGAMFIYVSSMLGCLGALFWRVPFRWPADAPFPPEQTGNQ